MLWVRMIPMPRIRSMLAALFAVTLLLIALGQARAVDVEPPTFWESIQEKTIYERVWEKLTFYENEDNDVIQALLMVGRYQGQFWAVDAGQGNASGWENRRFFLGAEAELFRQLTLQAQIKINPDLDPFYNGLYQAFVEWSPAESFSLSVGRLDFLFTGLERSVSSTRIVTFERGLLVNQVMPGEVVGAVVEGNAGDFSYRAGVVSGSIENEFTDFAGGVGVFGGVGYDLPLFYETGGLHLDYLFNDGNPSNNALEPYDHVVSLWHQGNAGPFGLGVDLTWAHGLDARPAVFGVTLLPTWLLVKNVLRKGDALQAVLRYQFAASDSGNGLQLQPRYEQELVPNGTGNRYQAIYGGLNYLLFGDRLKLMTGVEYSSMQDSAHDAGEFKGWTYFAGVRLFF
jgi:phosphate-selective porin OprO/OprP